MTSKPASITILTSPDILGDGWVVVFDTTTGAHLRTVEPDESIVAFLTSILIPGTAITRVELSGWGSGLNDMELSEWWEGVQDEPLSVVFTSAAEHNIITKAS